MACGTTAPFGIVTTVPSTVRMYDWWHASACGPSSSRGSRSTTYVPGWRRTSRNTVSPYEPLGYLRYVAFSSRFALDVENGEESRT